VGAVEAKVEEVERLPKSRPVKIITAMVRLSE
jgi:hypothetical protein